MIIHPTGKFDNHAAQTRHITVRPLSAAMGAEICGAEISSLSDEQFAEIRSALFRHKMIYFRDQQVSHADQEAFSLRFGPFAEDAYTKGVPGHPDVQPLIKEAHAKTGMVFGAGWHTDSPFLPMPPAISMLYGVDIPPYGGDTIWANSALAYAMLSDTMKQMIAPLKVHMSMKLVLASAQTHAEADGTPIGRLAATRDSGKLPDDVMRKVKGLDASTCAHAPGDGREGALLRRDLCGGHRGADAGRGRAAAEIPGGAHHAACLHLPPALGAAHLRAVGQSDLRAPGVQRL